MKTSRKAYLLFRRCSAFILACLFIVPYVLWMLCKLIIWLIRHESDCYDGYGCGYQPINDGTKGTPPDEE